MPTCRRQLHGTLFLFVVAIPNGVALTSFSGFGRHDGTASSSLCLQEYMDQLGAVRYCEIGSTNFGRGLVATKDLHPGETILQIPLSATLTIDTSDDSDRRITEDDAWAAHLAKKLLELCEQGPCPYVDALPPPPPTPARGDWSRQAIEALDDPDFEKDIQQAIEWRNRQCERYILGDLSEDDDSISLEKKDPQMFLDALDLVSSRTIRCGDKFMLVPYLDMANYASQDQGGGFYKIENNASTQDMVISLKVGARGVRAGNEIFLDYGDRRNEEWLLYYGFLPDRNNAECVTLPESKQQVSWSNVHSLDERLRTESRTLLERAATSLTDDIKSLKQIENLLDRDTHIELALKYRISRKSLLSAAEGAKSSSAFFSSFFEDADELNVVDTV